MSWTWQLFKTTGSKMHFMALEEYTKKNNLLKGVAGEWYRSSADGNNIGSSFYAASSEKDIYRSMGLDYIVPELRQGRDEIELSGRANYRI